MSLWSNISLEIEHKRAAASIDLKEDTRHKRAVETAIVRLNKVSFISRMLQSALSELALIIMQNNLYF